MEVTFMTSLQIIPNNLYFYMNSCAVKATASSSKPAKRN